VSTPKVMTPKAKAPAAKPQAAQAPAAKPQGTGRPFYQHGLGVQPTPKEPATSPPIAKIGGAGGKGQLAKAPPNGGKPGPAGMVMAMAQAQAAAVGKGQAAAAGKGQAQFQAATIGKGQAAMTGKGPAQGQAATFGKGKPGAPGHQGSAAAEAKAKLEARVKAQADAQANLRLRNLEAHMKRLLAEYAQLPEDKKGDACPLIVEKFVEQMSVKHLERLVAEFVAAGVNPNGSGQAEEAPPEPEEAAPEEAAPDETMEGEAPQEEQADEEGNAAAMAEAMEAFLQACADTQLPSQWMQVWSEVGVPVESQQAAIAVLLEVAAAKENTYELTPQIIVELVRTKKVQMKCLEAALKEFAGRLEELVEVNENAWHLESSFLLLLFPKTVNSSWGLLHPGWNWYTWWQMAEQILSSADRFRAFDILVLVLQMMQERSGAVINKQQVWMEAQRRQKVRKVLCSWGEMDEDSVVETLSAYGVEL